MIEALKFFVIRTPLMPVSTCSTEIFKTNELAREALYLASKTTLNELDKAKNVQENLRLTLLKYFRRMTTRCTPFGLFAGISLGYFDDRTDVELAPKNEYRRLTRLDGDAAYGLVDNLILKYGLKKLLRYRTNDYIYNGKPGFLRYLERIDKDGSKGYQISSIEDSPYLQTILNVTKNLVHYSEIVDSVIAFDVEKEDAEEFVEQLIDIGILICELEVNVTGYLYFDRVINCIKNICHDQEVSLILRDIQSALKSLDRSFGLNKIDDYRKIELNVFHDFSALNRDGTQLFQVDLFKPTRTNIINKKIINDVQGALHELHKLFPGQRNSAMRDFISHFVQKFGDSEVSLMELLDPDFGLSYPVNANRESDRAPLTEGLKANRRPSTQLSQMLPLHIALWNEFHQSFSNGSPIYLDENWLSQFYDTKTHDWPSSFFSFGSLIAKSSEAIDKGDYYFDLEFTSGPSIANLLGRFCTLDDELELLIRNELQREQESYEDLIIAEIVHSPQPRVANIATRPTLRQYEIPILTTASVEDENLIRLEDLTVRVEDNQIILFSTKLKKRILPRLSSAHNFKNDSLPIYEFLSELQFENVNSALKWDWGGLESLKFLPRVVLGKVILSKARWYFGKTATKLYLLNSEQVESVRNSLSLNNVPTQVLLVTNGDLKLRLDFKDDDDLRILIYYARVHGEIVLVEDITSGNEWVMGPEGTYASEVIIPWASRPSSNQFKCNLSNGVSKYLVGSEWLYVKIYSGVVIGEELLLNKLAPAFMKMIEGKTIEQWFFIRYADPDFHLRIRFKGKGKFYGDVIERINDILAEEIKSQRVWNIQIESYQPELYRYGGDFIKCAEQIFCYDSYACIESLQLFAGDVRDEVRWQIAVLGVDYYLSLFGMNLSDRIDFFKKISKGFLKEFNLEDEKEQLKRKYRQYKATLFTVLSDNPPEYLRNVSTIFDDRGKHVSELLRTYQLSINLIGKVQGENIIHMFLNRIFRSKPRFQEAILYDFLHQYYKSQFVIQSLSKNKVA